MRVIANIRGGGTITGLEREFEKVAVGDARYKAVL